MVKSRLKLLVTGSGIFKADRIGRWSDMTGGWSEMSVVGSKIFSRSGVGNFGLGGFGGLSLHWRSQRDAVPSPLSDGEGASGI